MRLSPENGRWGATDQGRTLTFSYDSDYTTSYEIGPPQVVEVPAGKFCGCVKALERFHRDKEEDSPVLWEIQTFWAPGVGKVKEIYKRADGTVVYELELVRFTVAR